MDERQTNIRNALTEKISKMIKRHGYDERQVIQVLRVTPDTARALLAGEFAGMSDDQLRRMISVLG